MASLGKIYVAGHRGMVGAAVVRELARLGLPPPLTAAHGELDLTDQAAVRAFFARHRPDCVVVAAARVGGIEANRSALGAFLYENLMIAANVVHAAFEAGVPRLLFLGSSCIYPRLAPQPIPESALLTGPLEPTNEGYALAKIAGLKLCQFYRQQYGVLYHSAMPTNLYGTGDNYHPQQSHVLPALIRRFEDARLAGAREVTLWGSGTPRREFLHVDDLARALVFLLQQENPPDWVNVGSGEDLTIRELAERVRGAVGSDADIRFDPAMPDGPPRKLCDTALMRGLGWRPEIALPEGLARTVAEYRAEAASGRVRG
ncbi:MAG: GDP-L-fucose synthase [Verrucomicrobiota bacterium]|jgi:GDP-L-fucose synthase|nr:GDP-L-fucose synthase [Verrucomicrobiota bacterium]